MPSLLQKLSFFDPESGRYFIVADDGFYWKEAKKSPQDSKVTRLMQQYGWELKHGNDVWLIFRQRGQRGEVTVTRGSKEWYYDQPTTGMFESDAEGAGLESLHQALESGMLKPKSKGMTAAFPVPYGGPERRKDFQKREQFDREAMYSVSLGLLHESLAKSNDLAEQQEIKQEIARLEEMREHQRRTGSAATTAVNNAGNGHDEIEGELRPDAIVAASRYQDRSGKLTPKAQAAWEAILATGKDKIKYSGAGGAILPDGTKIHSHIMKSLFGAGLVEYVTYDRETGKTIDPEFGWHFTVNRPQEKQGQSLMGRPDYKIGAVLAINGKMKTACCVRKTELYVSGVTYEQGNSFKLASFKFSPALSKAVIFSRYTAENLAQQIEKFGVTAQMIIAKPAEVRKQADEHSLNGFPVMSLEDFVADQEPDEKMAAAPAPAMGEVERDQPATDQEFGLGSKHRELSDEEMKEYMERVENRSDYEKEKLENRGKGKKTEEQKVEEERVKAERQKDKYSLPILHRGNIHIVNESGKEYDLDRLKADIMKRPDRLLKKNEKMQHSGVTKQYYNIGLAALKGLAVNEKTGKFVVVDTCPGAGICKTYCYAMRGNYVRMPATSLNQSRVLNFLVNHPDKFKNMLSAEITLAETKADEGTKVVVRWHDAGDFFSPQYMNLAFDVARQFPDVEFYAYTKVGDVANAKKPANFIINFSEGALPGETKKVDLTQIKSSITVPQKRFWDLIVTKGAHTVKNEAGQVQFKSAKAWDEFKDRMVEDYKIKKDSILLYNEYMAKKQEGELGDKPKWNVVVPPGGGDDAANDPVVIGSYLMWH